ncbi:MAG: M15 family metallopeptidase [Candidatus Aminicenantaceae bacterium]
MSNTRQRAVFNQKFALLSLYAKTQDIDFIIFSYTRTPEEQKKLFDEGKSKCDGYDKISYHQKDRARDIVIIDSSNTPIWNHIPEYDVLGKFWKSIGGRWGGDWSSLEDIYHFEY